MDPNESTKSGPEQEQVQSPGPQESARQAEEPGSMNGYFLESHKIESPRKCKVCGGPNHYGCGCEAKQLSEAKEAGHGDKDSIAKALQEPEPQPESEVSPLTPAEEQEVLDEVTQAAKDIKTMSEGFETLCVCLYDTNNLLKIIAGDLITIRKFLTKEDEVKSDT